MDFLLRITRSSAYAVTVLVITVARFGGRDSSTPALQLLFRREVDDDQISLAA
jgi:hypothetical protein